MMSQEKNSSFFTRILLNGFFKSPTRIEQIGTRRCTLVKKLSVCNCGAWMNVFFVFTTVKLLHFQKGLSFGSCESAAAAAAAAVQWHECLIKLCGAFNLRFWNLGDDDIMQDGIQVCKAYFCLHNSASMAEIFRRSVQSTRLELLLPRRIDRSSPLQSACCCWWCCCLFCSRSSWRLLLLLCSSKRREEKRNKRVGRLAKGTHHHWLCAPYGPRAHKRCEILQ